MERTRTKAKKAKVDQIFSKSFLRQLKERGFSGNITASWSDGRLNNFRVRSSIEFCSHKSKDFCSEDFGD